MDPTAIAFNVSAFIAGIALLQQGADKFTNSTIEIAKFLKVSDILVALLTAGAEWEELSIVVLCLIQDRHELAIGLIVGSCIANVLGALSLSLVMHSGEHQFVKSSKLYSIILFVVNAIVALLALLDRFNRDAGIALLALFASYVLLVSYCINRGYLSAPRDVHPQTNEALDEPSGLPDEDELEANGTTPAPESADERTGLLSKVSKKISEGQQKLKEARSRIQHVITPIKKLINGLTALPISAFVLSHSSLDLADSLEIPDLVFGVTALAFATNLPEKLANISDNSPESIDFLIATIVGGNTFLLTLCLGIVLISGSFTEKPMDNLVLPPVEAIWMCSSAAVMMLMIIWGRPYKYAGYAMIAAYIVFFVLELLPFVDLSKVRIPDFPQPYPGYPNVTRPNLTHWQG